MSEQQVPDSLNLNPAASITPEDVQLEVPAAESPSSQPSTSASGTPTSAGGAGTSSGPASEQPTTPDSNGGAAARLQRRLSQLNLEEPPTVLDWEEVSDLLF